jgi:MYXO-CTERM domain-containing protein
MREQGGGMHSYSQNYKRLHFGLAGNTQVDEVTVEWPSGIIQKLNNLAADQILSIVEEGEVPEPPPPIDLTPSRPVSAGSAGFWLLGVAGLAWLRRRVRPVES